VFGVGLYVSALGSSRVHAALSWSDLHVFSCRSMHAAPRRLPAC